jgi:glutathione S-transferase
MILFGQFDSPFVRRVAVTMTHYGMGFERRTLSVFGDFDDLQGVNPLGKVPALVLDDGFTLYDSSFILDWLDEQAGPERALTPAGGNDRRAVQQLVAVALGVAEKSVERNGETVRRPEDKRVPENVARIDRQIGAALAWLEERAGDGWLYGDAMSQADVTLTAALGHLSRRHPQLLVDDRYPNVEALATRCEAMPAFQAMPFEAGG